VVSLDEHGAAGHRQRGREPPGKIPGTIVIACRSVDFFLIGPNTEVPDLLYPIKACVESRFECEDRVVEALHRTMNVTRRTHQHAHPLNRAAPSEGYIHQTMSQYYLTATTDLRTFSR
jgi:hypothetical protein